MNPAEGGGPTAPPSAGTAGPLAGDPAPSGPARGPSLVVAALVAGIAAGVAAWLLGEAVHERYTAPDEFRGNLGKSTEMVIAQAGADRANAALASGLLGALLGTALGVAGGLARGSVRRGVLASLLGLIAGAAAGAAAAWGLAPILTDNLDLATGDMMLPLLVHGGIAAAVGAAGGLAFGLGCGTGRMAATGAPGGMIGAAVGASAYVLVGTLAFPLDGADQLVASTVATRALGRLAVAVLAALGAATVLEGGRSARGPERAASVG